MRTTIDLDDDLIAVTKQLAQQHDTTMSKVITVLIRRALEPKAPAKVRNGVPLFTPKPGAKLPGLELVNRLRDER